MKVLTPRERSHYNQLARIRDNELTRFNFLETDCLYRIKDYIRLLQNNHSIKRFSIYFKHMNMLQAKLIFNFLEQRKDIKEIKIYDLFENISENNDQELYSEILKMFIKLLNDGSEINNFPIVFNKIKFIEAQTLTPYLVNNKFLKTLNLPGNEIGDDGVRIILESLKLSKALESINFENNKLTDESTLYIKQFLQDNQSIKKFDLCDNDITNTGFELLKQGLIINHSLLELELLNNKFNKCVENYSQSKELVKTLLQINSYIKNIRSKQSESLEIISGNQKLSEDQLEYTKSISEILAIELESAIALKSHLLNKKALLCYLEELNRKIQFHYVGTPAPLEIILKAEKFLEAMNLYISKCTKKPSNLNQTQATEKTIKLFASKNPEHKKYSFYQFMEIIDEERIKKISAEINATDEQKKAKLKNYICTETEKEAISIYQTQINFFADGKFIENIDTESIINILTAFMADNIKEAIEIQQLNRVFHDTFDDESRFFCIHLKLFNDVFSILNNNLFTNFYNIFGKAIANYAAASGYVINEYGKSGLNINEIVVSGEQHIIWDLSN